ncbi:hypothetical protein [Pedobacter duraquae]|uniref:Uncharacterized protein n=1 Tax=Pedobacter duraquae TaxID=425511 RepID=A0A4R6IEA7_9SPHI|nr:hypothetical protein [Pedobacter duraquae]TDO20304.1 hypothetical protein CLV32_4064 [Pedobacter duraquae]
MNTFVIEDFSVDDQQVCNFYTVRFEGQEASETHKFYERFYFDEAGEFYDDAQDIHALIEELAERGTKLILRARAEARVFALPPKGIVGDCEIEVFGNNLRLYYVELAQDVLVLLGGGIAHEGPAGDVPMQFKEAQTFAKKILEAKDTFFEVRGKRLVSLESKEIIIN